MDSATKWPCGRTTPDLTRDFHKPLYLVIRLSGCHVRCPTINQSSKPGRFSISLSKAKRKHSKRAGATEPTTGIVQTPADNRSVGAIGVDSTSFLREMSSTKS